MTNDDIIERNLTNSKTEEICGMEHAQHAIEVANGVATKAIIGGAGTALYGGFTATDIAAFGGLGVAIIGLLSKIYFDYQLLQIAKIQVSDEKLAELARRGKLDQRKSSR